MDKKRALPIVVKDTIDFVYEMLINNPDGLQISFKDYGKIEKRIVSILIKRGIITKTPISTGRRGCAWKYKWIATMPPTKVLYGSVVDEYRDIQRAWKSSSNEKKKDYLHATTEKKEDAVVLPVVELPQEERINALDGFSDQELWDELKKRGYSIEDNRLVIVKKTYLD